MADTWEDLAEEDSWENFEEREAEEEKKKKEEEEKKKKEEEEAKAKKKGKNTKAILAERDRKDREREEKGYAMTEAEQKRRVEETDYRHAQELFGDLATTGELDSFVPKTSMDFTKYSSMLCERATCFASDAHYNDFVTDICKNLVTGMKSEDLRKLIATLNSVLNEKIKTEKGGVVSVASRQKKKSQEARAKALALKQLDEEVDEEAEDEYSRYEDKYDFMWVQVLTTAAWN